MNQTSVSKAQTGQVREKQQQRELLQKPTDVALPAKDSRGDNADTTATRWEHNSGPLPPPTLSHRIVVTLTLNT